MNVKLLTHTPNPEKTIAMAAKLCYSSSDIETLGDSLTEENCEAFITKLMTLGHESPLEHVSFTFAIEGISRAASHQLVRHRIASYSQKSQRYVNEGHFDYIIPPTIRNNEETLQIVSELFDQIQDCYDDIRKIIKHDLTESGMSEIAAEKLANEDARFVLPNACETKIIVTMNIRSLYNFFKHRCCNRAQWEIRAVATEMLKQCIEVSPILFSKAGPDCATKGICPEGSMSCKKPYRKNSFINKEN